MTNYLITGGCGFISSRFIKTIYNKDPDAIVVNLDVLTYAGNTKNLGEINNYPNYRFHEGDINDHKLVQQILRFYNVDKVVHLAAETHVDNSIKTPLLFMKTNVMGTATLLLECKKYWDKLIGKKKKSFRFLHVSTDEVFGELEYDDPKFNEETPYDPRSPYSASKAGSDHLVNSYIYTYGFPAMISHCVNNYGTHQHPEKLIPKVINNIIAEKLIPVYGDGQQVRDWIYVGDHCNALYDIITKGSIGSSYCIGSNEEHANIEIIEKICDILDKGMVNHNDSSRNLINFVRDRPGHDFRYAIDSSKIQNELGWRPATSLDEGLEKTVFWYLRNQPWVMEMEMKNK